jgi:hypothetical protein
MKEVVPLYLTKDGLPRKECLLSLDDVHDALEISYSDDPIERFYQRNLGISVMSALGKKMRAHNIIWITPEIENKVTKKKEVLYGLSQDEEKRQNSQARCDDRKRIHARIANQHRALIEGNRELFPINKKG